MRRMVLLAAVGLAACGDGGGPSGEGFIAFLSSQNEVPPVVAPSGGTASLTSTGSAIDYAVTVQGITGITHAGIYAGEAGVVGPELAELFGGPTTGGITSGTLATGTLVAAEVAVPLDSLLSLMRAGKAYVNVLTLGRPSGEIRGQITPN